MRKFKILGLFAAIGFCVTTAGAAAAPKTDPEVVTKFDVNAYMGLWYDIAHSPNSFQKDCQHSTALYELTADQKVKVLNTCFKVNGESRSIEGLATAEDPNVPAKLKVDFGFFRKGDYWITKLGPNYQWAVVSGPQKKSIFILARQAPMEEGLLNSILDEMKVEGYRTDNLVFDKY